MTRARIRRSELSTQRRYRLDRAWALIDVKSNVGLGRYWLVVRIVDGGEYVAARHRTRSAAERTFKRLNRRIER